MVTHRDFAKATKESRVTLQNHGESPWF